MNADNFLSQASPVEMEFYPDPQGGGYIAAYPGRTPAEIALLSRMRQVVREETEEDKRRRRATKAKRRLRQASKADDPEGYIRYQRRLRGQYDGKRYCVDCGADITLMNMHSERCILCRVERTRERDRAKYRKRGDGSA